MTSKPIPQTPVGQFPVFPPRGDMQNPIYLHNPAHQAALRRHFGSQDTTMVLGEVPVGRNPRQRRGLRVPDLLVAFGVGPARIIEQRGYSIEEQGKPPDFVLEIASPTTGRNDYTDKRRDYAAFGIPEYWQFDPSGDRYYDAPLAGDQLVGEEYHPISIVSTDGDHHWGHSTALNLDLCWEDGQLRWWDPAAGRYLRTFDDEAEERIAERAGRLAAEERVRELEAELRRLQGQ